eukprot:1806864-Amphidinium_carterae.1
MRTQLVTDHWPFYPLQGELGGIANCNSDGAYPLQRFTHSDSLHQETADSMFGSLTSEHAEIRQAGF